MYLIFIIAYLFTADSFSRQANNRVTTLKVAPKSLGILEKDKVNNFGLSLLAGASAGFFLRLKSTRAIDIVLPECSDSIVVLKNSNREIVLIGTAHISVDSVNLVRRTIAKVTPGTVMIELDPKRLGKLNVSLSEAGFDVPPPLESTVVTSESTAIGSSKKRKEGFFSQLLSGLGASVKELSVQVSGVMLGKVLSQFYKSIESLGFVAGGEFKAAVDEARGRGARVLLGDRDVDITLERLSSAIGQTEPESFDRLLSRLERIEEASGIAVVPESAVMNKDQLTSFVEMMKQRETLRTVAAAVREEVPAVYGALIGERDAYMSRAIALSSSPALVAVVGMMHLEGIENALVNDYNFSVISRNCSAPAVTSDFNIPIIS